MEIIGEIASKSHYECANAVGFHLLNLSGVRSSRKPFAFGGPNRLRNLTLLKIVSRRPLGKIAASLVPLRKLGAGLSFSFFNLARGQPAC